MFAGATRSVRRLPTFRGLMPVRNGTIRISARQLDSVLHQVENVTLRAKNLVAGRCPSDLTTRLEATSWSVVECLDHLTQTANAFIPAIASAMAGAPRLTTNRALKNFSAQETARGGSIARGCIPAATHEIFRIGAASPTRHTRPTQRDFVPLAGSPGFRRAELADCGRGSVSGRSHDFEWSQRGDLVLGLRPGDAVYPETRVQAGIKALICPGFLALRCLG